MIFSLGRINIIGEHTDYNDRIVFLADVNKEIVAAIAKSTADFCVAFAVDKNGKTEFPLDKIKPILFVTQFIDLKKIAADS